MSEAKFTKGVWSVIETKEDYEYTKVIADCGEVVVVTTINASTEPLDCFHDARLIAAAPEMYDVISEMLVQFDAEETCHNEADYVVIREAKKVLAKARGES